MKTEVFDQEKAEPKYELYDVNSLYPEKVEMNNYPAWNEKYTALYDQKQSLEYPGSDATDEEIDAYYREQERLNNELDSVWKNRPFIEKFFFVLGIPIAVVFLSGQIIELIIETLKDKWYDRKNRNK